MKAITAIDGNHCGPASFEMIFDAVGTKLSQAEIVKRGDPWINPDGTMAPPHWNAHDGKPMGTRGVQAVCRACGFPTATVDLVVDDLDEVEKRVSKGEFAILFMSNDTTNEHHGAPYAGRNSAGDHTMMCPTNGQQPVIAGRTIRACCIKGL